MRPTIAVLVLSLLVAACAPTIGNRQDVRQTSFVVGHTQQDEVLNTLGLPAEITKSEALKREYWAYRDKPELVGIIIAVPDGPGAATTQAIQTGNDGRYDFADAAAVYVFNATGTLVDVRYPQQEP